jgi:quercetin dioxygenase-like cupin family protein
MVAKMMTGLAAGFALLLGTAGVTTTEADDQPITRTELMRADVAGVAGKETVIYIADLKPGAVGGKHTHYGDEFVYILDGELIVEPVGKAPITLKAGQAGHFTPDVVHAARNGSANSASKVLVILVVDKGKPLAEAAK